MTDRTAADKVADALAEVVGRHGPNVGDDGTRLRELLAAALGGSGGDIAAAEIDGLVAAGELGLPRAIARGMSASTAATGMQGSGVSAGLAIWVATNWAKAIESAESGLGVTLAGPVASAPPAPATLAPPAPPAPPTPPAPPAPPTFTGTQSPPPLPHELPLPNASPPSTLARPGARPAPSVRPAVTPSPAPTTTPGLIDDLPIAADTPTSAVPAAAASATTHLPPAVDPDKSRRTAAPEAIHDLSDSQVDGPPVDPTVPVPRVVPAPPVVAPPPAVRSDDGLDPPAPAPDGASASGRRPAWLVPAAIVAILALGAGVFVVTKSSKDTPRAQQTTAADASTAETAEPDTASVADTSSVADATSAPDSAAPTVVSSDTTPVVVTIAALAGDNTMPSVEGMVPVPQGTYPVGSAKPDLLAESKRRDVAVAAYVIDRHEVTNAEYKAFVDQTAAAPPLTGWTSSGPPDAALDHPVRAITFEWATAYCQSRGKRLPTEVEWEVAAGGKDGTKYAWGNDLATVSLPIDGTYPVESVPGDKSSMGVFDLTGSVWEWVGDSYDPNKVGAGKHVLRGGQNGYIRNNWSRLPVDEKASNAVLGAGIRCAASAADGKKALSPDFLDYTRPADPVAPTITIPPGYKSYDDFSGSKLEWLEVSTPDFRFGYHPNKFFHLETKKPSTNVIALCPCITPPAPIGIVATGEVEPNLTEPAGTFEWGVIIRADERPTPKEKPTSFVALVVDPRNRHWRAFVHRPDGKTVDIGQAQLNSEETDTVTLELRDYGTKIEYYINGTYRGESPQGAALPKGNHAGFVLSSDADSTKVHIHFGSFGIRSIS